MRIKLYFRIALVGLMAGLLGTSASVTGGIIAENSVGLTGSPFAGGPGQSLTTPAGGPWKDITFNFYNSTTGEEQAEGNVYVFTTEYTGTPQALSQSTPGLLGSGKAAGPVYVFPPEFALSPNTQYFFYSDTRPGGAGGTTIADNSYAGGTYLNSPNGNGGFSPAACCDTAFSLKGTGVPAIVQHGPFLSNSGSAQAPGQSVTTPSGWPWRNIVFNLYSPSSGAPVAQGNVYILSTEYLGTPQALSQSTPGLIGVGSASDSAYVFPPELTLLPNTQYFFYCDSVPGGQGGAEGGGAVYAGGLRFDSSNGNQNFTTRPGAVSFSLNGIAVQVVRGKDKIGDGVQLQILSNTVQAGGMGNTVGGKIHSPSGGPDLFFRGASTPDFPGDLDTFVEWALGKETPIQWEGAVDGSDNWMKVIRDSDGAVSWAQFDFDFEGPFAATDPTLLSIPLYVTRSDGADFPVAEAVAAANAPRAIRKTGNIGDGVQLQIDNNSVQAGGKGNTVGGKIHSPAFDPDLFFRGASTPDFPGHLNTFVEWALGNETPIQWEGAVDGSDNWMKVIRDSDGAVSWAQFDFDFEGPFAATDPTLLSIPLYVTRPDGADFPVAEAVIAASVSTTQNVDFFEEDAYDAGNGAIYSPSMGWMQFGDAEGWAYSYSLGRYIYFNLAGPSLGSGAGIWFYMLDGDASSWVFCSKSYWQSFNSGAYSNAYLYINSSRAGTPGWFYFYGLYFYFQSL